MACYSAAYIAIILFVFFLSSSFGQSSSSSSSFESDLSSPPAPLQLWPAPTSYSNGSRVLNFSSASFNIILNPSSSKDLQNCVTRYLPLFFPHQEETQQGNENGNGISLIVNVNNIDVPLQLGVDESYELIIPSDGSAITISSATVYGAYYGFETLSQLIEFNFDTLSYEIHHTPWYIKDTPRFQHRGILIDTSRHFLPVPTIKLFIDSMTYAKMNTFHWHIVDTESFPVESKTYPKLWQGAWSRAERYSQLDVAEIIEYSRQRGVRVLPEFDIPGHAASWCTGYPEICPSTSCLEPLDVSKNTTFDLITNLFTEITGNKPGAGLFPDDYLHLGGDEVETECWTKTPHIKQWLTDNNMTEDDAYMYAVNRAHQIVIDQGRIPINWEEVFLHFGTQLDKRSIIHIWLNHATLAKVVAAGYRGILSNQDVWYLDHLDITWQQFYANEPFEGITDPKQQSLILGGEVCMWGETVDNSVFFNTVWPRAAAAAERLWSPAEYVDTAAAAPRISAFRCLLNARGVGAAPSNNTSARKSPPHAGGCRQ